MTLGHDVTDEQLEERRTPTGPGRPRHPDLHLGHHRPPQGLHAHPRQLHVRARRRRRRARRAVRPSDEQGEGASTLLFLPLAHVFARIIQVGCVKARVRMGHSADIKNLLDDFAEFRPTFILAVPRVFEKVFNTASQRAVADGRGKIFDRAADVAIAWSRGLENGRPSLAVRAQHRGLRPAGLRQAARRRSAAGARTPSPAARPLGERLGHFYRGIGVNVLEGYGLTETTAALTANLPDAQKVGTVGRPLQGTSVRVADDGELLFRGGQVFAGYWHNDEATAEAKDAQGWFHTGDVGEIDDEGFVRITGRKKEILVTAGGKNVAPAVLEDRLRAHPLVDQCIVVGDGQPFIAALVTLDPETLPDLGRAARQVHRRRRPRRRPRPAGRDRGGRRGGQQGRLQGRVDPQVRDPAGDVDRGGRSADPQPQAEARRRDARAPRRRGRPLRPLSARNCPICATRVSKFRVQNGLQSGNLSHAVERKSSRGANGSRELTKPRAPPTD